MFTQTVTINHVPATCMMDRCPSWTEPTGCWHAGKGYLSPATHVMMDGARALPTGSLNKVISSYSAIFNYLNFASSMYKYIYVCVCVCARARARPLQEREMESSPRDLELSCVLSAGYVC
jgi:hypothetical protein